MHASTTPRRIAIVTGAAQGIGAGTARRLAQDGFAVAADVADEAAVTRAVARVAAELGPPTVLVNNAGIGRAAGLVDMSTEDWEAVLGVNLRGPFLMTRATAPHMIAAGWGRVVSISSISALGDPGRVGYASAKSGLIGLTRTLAAELGPHGVTVNAVAPGFIVSAMTAATARRLGRDVGEHQRIAAESLPVGRVGQPEDVAHSVSFFASAGAGFVTGQVLYVAGAPYG